MKNLETPIWYPFTSPDKMRSLPAITSGKGNYLFTEDGRKYFDAISSLWANTHGHCHPKIVNAISEQAQTLDHSTLLGSSHPVAEKLATKLLSHMPSQHSKIFYSDSGSTAVEIALKIAFQYWQCRNKSQKQKFLFLEHSYHGDTLGAVSVGGISAFHSLFNPLLADNIQIPCPSHPVSRQPCRESERLSIQELKRLLKKRSSDIAALIIEPLVQGAGGMRMHSPEYLEEVYHVCHSESVLVIFDEVATGFGRTGKLFAYEHTGISPDIICMAKGLSGGVLPIAATSVNAEIFESFSNTRTTFYHGHTFTGNPISAAASIASLEIFEEKNMSEQLSFLSSTIANALPKLEANENVASISNTGCMTGIHIKSSCPRTAEKLCSIAMTKGVILRNLENSVIFMPPLSTTEDEVEMTINSILHGLEN